MRSFNKITAVILIVMILALSLSACSKEETNSFLNEITLGVWDRLLLDEKTHNVVEYVDNDTIKYQGNMYYLAPMIFIQDDYTTDIFVAPVFLNCCITVLNKNHRS